MNDISHVLPQKLNINDIQKISFLNKKSQRELCINRFYPGSILAHVPNQGNYESYFIYLDKEDFGKLEGKDWFNRKEMEELVSLNEDMQHNELIKSNYKNMFYFYDCEDSMKYNQVEETIKFVLN